MISPAEANRSDPSRIETIRSDSNLAEPNRDVSLSDFQANRSDPIRDESSRFEPTRINANRDETSRFIKVIFIRREPIRSDLTRLEVKRNEPRRTVFIE